MEQTEPKKPQVSIIIPIYNRAGFLKEALDSVSEQTFKDFEVIIVDDGSTDNPLNFEDILKTYQSKINLRYLRFEENQGVSASRNQGIRASKGDWIAFLDSDDLWLPKKLEIQTEYLRNNPTVQICQTEEKWIRHGTQVNPMKKHEKSGGNIFRRCLELCIVSPSATMISRKLLDIVGPFDESLPVCEDYDLWLRISYRYPIELIPETLIIKRGGHADQLSKKLPAMDYYRIQSIKNLLMNHPLSSDQGAQAIQELKKKCDIYANGARKRGKHKEAAEIEDFSKYYL